MASTTRLLIEPPHNMGTRLKVCRECQSGMGRSLLDGTGTLPPVRAAAGACAKSAFQIRD